MKSIAIITARGGSKRIPKKNIKNFLGKPIICYSIEAALKSEGFDEVMVSTDSDEIAEIARKSGASVPFLRSDKTSNDFSTTADVLEEVIHEYEMRGKNYDSFACIYPTAPFITAGRLKDAFKKFSMSEAYSLMTVVRFSFPPQRALVIRDNLITYQYPEFALCRSQDLEPIYHDCGQFYICNTSEFLKEHSMVTERTIPYEIPEEEVQDIDNLSDWIIAESKYKALHNMGR